MSTHKHFDKICCVVLALTLIVTVLFVNAGHFGVQKASAVLGYEKTLFDTSKVHTINIIMDNWEDFTANCKSEEYYACTVVIDNEAYKNVAIRGKGNTSLSQVNNDRYSYKIEFDHYDSSNTYYGLDKLCLNNIIQDNTYMKDYLTYQMMNEMGVASPLCSYAYITVNGEDWGLYLAVEGVEESFLQRNYGKDYGELYKPDSLRMGGGRGNGEKFDMDDFFGNSQSEDRTGITGNQTPDNSGGDLPQIPSGNADRDSSGRIPDGFGGGGTMTGSDDVLLKYIDDNTESYSNIFENAKTDITDADKTRLVEALKKLSNGADLENTVDMDAVIRYFVVHNFVVNFDSYTGSMIHNYYLYEKDGQMQMIPWDYNLAFGGFQSMDSATALVNYPIDSPVSGGSASDRPMIAWIFESEEYTELYHKYFSEFLAVYFDSGSFSGMIDNVAAMISPYVEKDPTKFCTYEEFQTGISTLKEFCLLRAESIHGQLDGTIGSASDTQKSDTLIDAGDMRISSMGSMSNTMGGGKDPSDGNPQKPQTDTDSGSTESTGRTPSEETGSTENGGSGDHAIPQMPDGQIPGGNPGGFAGGQTQGGAPPDFGNGENGAQGGFGGQTQRPDRENMPSGMGQMTPEDQSSMSPASLILILVSVLFLGGGLCFALLYKRRK